jgi:hypothetical protein
MPNEHKDIMSDSIKDNQTWNSCPFCGKDWKDEIATPGLIHRTVACSECKRTLTKEVEGHMWERKKK